MVYLNRTFFFHFSAKKFDCLFNLLSLYLMNSILGSIVCYLNVLYLYFLIFFLNSGFVAKGIIFFITNTIILRLKFSC